MTQFSLFFSGPVKSEHPIGPVVAFLLLFFLPGQNGFQVTHTWLDDTIEELRALRLTDLQAAEEGSIAAGHRQWHTGRAQILGTSRLLTC